MNARIVSFATVLDIVVLVGLGLGIIFAPLTLIWAFDDGFSTDLLMSWAAAVDIWLLGHGVPLSFTVPPDLADALSLGALSRDFTVDVALLGIGLLTLLWGFRIGRRETTAVYPVLVWTLAVGTLVLLSLALVVFMPAQVVSMPVIDALVRPALFWQLGWRSQRGWGHTPRERASCTALSPARWPTLFALASPPGAQQWLVWCLSQPLPSRFSWWRPLPR